jgi:hypothetical protein
MFLRLIQMHSETCSCLIDFPMPCLQALHYGIAANRIVFSSVLHDFSGEESDQGVESEQSQKIR